MEKANTNYLKPGKFTTNILPINFDADIDPEFSRTEESIPLKFKYLNQC